MALREESVFSCSSVAWKRSFGLNCQDGYWCLENFLESVWLTQGTGKETSEKFAGFRSRSKEKSWTSLLF